MYLSRRRKPTFPIVANLKTNRATGKQAALILELACMQNKIEVTFAGDHVRVIADGDKDYRFQNRLWREISETCEENQCFRILGVSHTTTPLEAVEGYDTARIFRELNIDNRYRLAWVETDLESRSMTEFIATVLANRGLPGRLFDTKEEARIWLFKPDEEITNVDH